MIKESDLGLLQNKLSGIEAIGDQSGHLLYLEEKKS